MPEQKQYDFDALLAKSQRLASHISDTGPGISSRHYSRGVAELSEASRQISRGYGAGDSGMGDRSGFDSAGLFEDGGAIALKHSASDVDTLRLEGTDVEGYLAHHHDLMILTAIDEAKHGAEEDIQEMQRRWAASEWTSAKSKFMESLGHRTNRWNLGVQMTPQSAGGGFAHSSIAKENLFTPDVSRLHRMSHMPETPLLLTAGGGGGGGAMGTPARYTPHSAQHATSFRTPAGAAGAGADGSGSGALVPMRPLISEFLREQKHVVRNLSLATHSSSDSSGEEGSRDYSAASGNFARRPCTDLLANFSIPSIGSNRSIVSDGLTKADLISYRSTLVMLSYMVGEGSDETFAAPGFFSPLCFDPAEGVHLSVIEEKKRMLTNGAMRYFEEQIFDVWSRAVDEAVHRGEISPLVSFQGGSNRQRVRLFVSHQDRLGNIPEQCRRVTGPLTAQYAKGGSGGGSTGRPNVTIFGLSRGGAGGEGGGAAAGALETPLWVFIYHCLRVGDIESVIAELAECVDCGYKGGEAAALNVLEGLNKLHKHEARSKDQRSSSVGARSRGGSGLGGGVAGSVDGKVLTDEEVRLLNDSMSECRAWYEQELALLAGDEADSAGESGAGAAGFGREQRECDPYRLIVFNLLGLADREGVTSCGAEIRAFSLEDFLWASLWFVQKHRLILAGTAANAGAVGSGGGGGVFVPSAVLTSPAGTVLQPSSRHPRISGELELFDLVLEYDGADYFDEDRTSPFRYASVLFCCHRFGDAIAHIWKANKAIPAVHLTVLALYYGLILPFLPLTQNPAHPLVSNRSIGISADPSPGGIFQIFMQTSVFAYYPQCCVDYLVMLDSNWAAHCHGLAEDLKRTAILKSQFELSRLLESFLCSLDREQLTVVVGVPVGASAAVAGGGGGRADGAARTEGRLDQYMTSAQIDTLLAKCAHHLLTHRKEAEAAIYFYELAGNYAEMVEATCTQLAAHLFAVSASATFDGSSGTGYTSRDFWRSVGESFIAQHSAESAPGSTSSRIYNYLVRRNETGLMNALVTLTRLYSFVDAYNAGAFEAALEIADSCGVLPPRLSEVDACSASVHPLLRPVVDDLALRVMDCTTRHFSAVKTAQIATGPPTSGSGSGVRMMGAGFGAGGAGRAGGDAYAGLLTDKQLRLQGLQERGRALLAFAQRASALLVNRHETVSMLARMETLLS